MGHNIPVMLTFVENMPHLYEIKEAGSISKASKDT